MVRRLWVWGSEVDKGEDTRVNIEAHNRVGCEAEAGGLERSVAWQ